MINSKEDLLRYLDTERLLFLGRNYGVNALARRKPKMKGEQEWKFVISLRNMEYWINVISKKGVLTKLLHFPNYYFHRKRYAKMRDTYCVQIPPNVFGEGLFIQHLHGIIISSML